MLQYLALPLRWRMNKVTFSFNTILITTLIVGLITSYHATTAMNDTQRHMYRDKTLGMFKFAYSNYMTRAYPADELMPLSCTGRYRGNRRSRGDIDDSLGNFSLTLIDSLDTLAVLGDVDLFEEAVQNVIRDVTFDTDVVVSVFETNIRVLGGLLGGHVMADHFKHAGLGLSWYNNQLLDKAVDIGRRLLKAFDTASGLPYPRVNLRYGIRPQKSRTGTEKDTCTSCAGTIILEFAALSRLSGDPIYEDKAHAAMDFLWKQRHRASDLVGTVINIHNGDWVRKDSGIGAGIDSYYEYLLKAYVLLGDEKYLTRFNKHYEAVMRYINQGPLMVNVHMHKPMSTSRNYMDALLAFWPGLQVLKGDIASAIEIHEMLYQVIQKHNFLPEAFTTDFRVHWAQHPLRPEFIESTYFLYKATGDPHYLEVGAMVLDNLEKHAKVKCGYAAIKDVTTGKHEDQMDSFVLAETFKYLYLLFADKSDVKLNVDDYIFTTEAHLLPLSLGLNNSTGQDVVVELKSSNDSTVSAGDRTCPNSMFLFPGDSNYAYSIRNPLKNLVSNTCAKNKQRSRPRLRASHFVAGDTSQAETLGRMGIKIMTMSDGRVQLLHSTNDAATVEEAEDGLMFMEEMIELSRTQQQQEGTHEPRVVQLISAPFFGHETYNAGPAQFGPEFGKDEGYTGDVVLAEPLSGCSAIQNAKIVRNKIAIVERGQCMFIDKARHLEAAGVMGAIVLDTTPDLSSESSPLFAMSGDGTDNVHIPMVFLFRVEADKLLGHLEAHPDLRVFIGKTTRKSDTIMREMLQAKHIALSYIDTQRDTSDEGYVSDEDETVSYMDESDLEPEWTEQSQLLLDVIEGRRDVTEATSAIFGEQTDVYSHLIESLNKYTNFDSLPNKDTYMDALSDLSDGRLQDAAQRTSDRLTQLMNVLKSIAPPLQKESDQESTGKASTSTTSGNILLDMIRYLDEPPSWMKLEDVEDLLEESVKISTADVSRKLEQWRNLILDSVELKEGRGTGTSGKGGTSSNPTGTADSSTTGSNSNTGTHSGSTGTGSDSIDSGTLAYDSKTGYRHPDTLPLPTDSTNSRTTSRHSKHKGFSKDEL